MLPNIVLPFYVPPLWANKEIKRTLSQLYRRYALRVTSGFQKISADTALILAGLLPGGIFGGEMLGIYTRRSKMQYGAKTSMNEKSVNVQMQIDPTEAIVTS